VSNGNGTFSIIFLAISQSVHLPEVQPGWLGVVATGCGESPVAAAAPEPVDGDKCGRISVPGAGQVLGQFPQSGGGPGAGARLLPGTGLGR